MNKRNGPGCDAPFTDTTKYTGDYTVQANELPFNSTGDITTYYFACGVGDGYHCKYGGLRATIYVVKNLNKCPVPVH